MTSYYTTFQAARICHVSQGSIIRWIHEGRLPAAVTPGGHHRIQKEDLRKFLVQLGMPVPASFEWQKRFLILSENHVSCEPLCRQIENLFPSAEVQAAGEPFTAGWKVSRFSPDLILLDSGYSYEEGGKICSALRGLPEGKQTPILFLTPERVDSARQKAVSLGAIEFLPKPFKKDALLRKICALLDGSFELKKAGS